MALNNLGMGFLFTARDLASGTMRRIGMGLRNLGLRGRGAGTAISAGLGVATAGAISLAAGVGTLMAAFSAARAAGAFEQTMARVGALSRATATELRQLSDAAVEAGLRTQFSPTEAAEGLAELAVRGFQVNEAIQALTGTLDLAQGGQISVAQASATVGAALRAFSLDASRASITTDQLLRISNVTALQANELELALGNVARGAGVARQSIEEMLPAIGLVRNTGVQASVAASSVSSALLFMSRRTSDFDRVLGRTNSLVDESTGEFRDFMDIVLETSNALESRYTNQADRARVATELFGRFGLTAFSAISRQLSNGIRNAEGQIVRGAEAIDFLRKSMGGAAGAAEEFRERLQNTFQGQVALLRGTVQTLAAVVGGPFGRAFMPILAITRYALSAIIRFFRAIPESAQTAVAMLIMFAGVLASAGGAVTLLTIGIALLIPLLKVMLITFAVLVVALGGFVIAIGAVVGALGALYVAYRRNIGGFASFVDGQVQRIQLVWQTLVDLFTHGGVREGSKILAPQNRGLLQFALNVYALGRRIVRFVQGIGKGFTEGLDMVRPAIVAMMDALRDLGEAFGFLGSREAQAMVTADSTQSFFQRGAGLGRVLARVIGVVAEYVRSLSRYWLGLVRGLSMAWRLAGPGIIMLRESLRELFTQLSRILGPLGQTLGLTTNAGDGFVGLGEAVAAVAGFLVGAFANGLSIAVRLIMLVVTAIRFAVQGFQVLWNVGATIVDGLSAAFQNMGDTITMAILTVIDVLARAAAAIPPRFRPGFANDLISAGERARQERAQLAGNITERTTGVGEGARERFAAMAPGARQLGEDFGRTFTAGASEVAAQMARPAVAAQEPGPGAGAVPASRVGVGSGEGGGDIANVMGGLAREVRRSNEQPIVVQVVVDGEVVDEQRRTRGEAAGRQVGTGG